MQKNGFTLMGTSIVLMMLAVLATTIATGRDLIRSAEVRSVITDFNSFEVAINTFELKYGEKPGDIPFATDYWPDANTENGDGDQIFDLPVTEGLRAWQHLTLSIILDGKYSGSLDGSSDAEWDFASMMENIFFSNAYASAPKVDICHEGMTLNVAESSVPAHLAHGDTEGACGDDSDSDDSDSDSSDSDDSDSDSDDSDNDQEKYTICHLNNGNGGVTITVASPAVYNAHLNHGDSVGECAGEGEDDDVTYVGKYTVGMNVPAARMKSAGFSLEYATSLYGRTGNIITFATESDPLLGGAVISPSEAWIIDEKIDDGDAHKGNITASNGELGNGEMANSCLSSSNYYHIETNRVCQLHLWLDDE